MICGRYTGQVAYAALVAGKIQAHFGLFTSSIEFLLESKPQTSLKVSPQKKKGKKKREAESISLFFRDQSNHTAQRNRNISFISRREKEG
jgi:hypothetical protein